MTAPPDAATVARAESLAMLREAFPEPEWSTWLSLGPENSGWQALAGRLTRTDYPKNVSLSAWGDSPLAAAQALLAAWKDATRAVREAENEAIYDMVQAEDARSLAGVSAHDPLRRLMAAIRARRKEADDAAAR